MGRALWDCPCCSGCSGRRRAPRTLSEKNPAEYLAILQAEVEELEAQRKALAAAVQQVKHEVEDETSARDRLSAEVADRRREADAAEARRDDLKADAAKAEARLAEVNGEVARLDEALRTPPSEGPRPSATARRSVRRARARRPNSRR